MVYVARAVICNAETPPAGTCFGVVQSVQDGGWTESPRCPRGRTMDFINAFLSKAYDTVGLRVLNDAAANVKSLRLAGAILIIAMFAAAGLFAFNGNWWLAGGSVLFFIVTMVLLIILGAVAGGNASRQAAFFSWAILLIFVAFLSVLFSSFAFSWPRPLGRMFEIGGPLVTLDGSQLRLDADVEGNLIVTATELPRQPYSVTLELLDPDTHQVLHAIPLRLPESGEERGFGATIPQAEVSREYLCVLTLRAGKSIVETVRQSVNVNAVK